MEIGAIMRLFIFVDKNNEYGIICLGLVDKMKNNKIDNITLVIIIINILMYLYAFFLYGNHAIKGLNNKEAIKIGGFGTEEEPINLFVSLFVHGSLVHLITNLVSLYLIGMAIRILNLKKLYIVIYILTGIIGNITTVLLIENTVSIGASGAISGIIGFLLIELYCNENTKELAVPIYVLAVGMMIANLFDVNANVISHIIGLVSGFLLYLIIYAYKKVKEGEKI